MFLTNVSVSNGTDGMDLAVESTRTFRSLFEEANVPYDRGILQYNGAILSKGDLDRPIEDFTDNPDKRQILRMTVKADNAADAEATAIVHGGALVITSSATLAQIKNLQKYRPQALKLMEGEGANKKQVFMVSVNDKGAGCVSKMGVVYSNRTDKDGKATVTIEVPANVENVKEWAIETLGTSILSLRKTEAQFAAMLEDANNEKAAVEASITVA